MEASTDNPLTSWKAAVRSGAAPSDATLHKAFVADSIKSEDGGRTYTFTISTGVVDRDMDTLAVEGWRTGNFLKAGGPVLWAHQSRELPIGKATWVKAQGGALKARVEFAPADVYPFAETVRQLVEFGALKSTSVGFLPDQEKAIWNEERGGFDFKGQELLEFSLVPVPSNPEAVLESAKGIAGAMAAGVDLAPLRKALGLACEAADGGKADPPAFDPEPFVAIARAAFQKRGRVLSQANEERIRRAQSSAEDCASALAEVMGSMPMEEPDDMPKASCLYVTPKATLAIDPQVVVAAVQAAVSETVRAEVNAARGRLD